MKVKCHMLNVRENESPTAGVRRHMFVLRPRVCRCNPCRSAFVQMNVTHGIRLQGFFVQVYMWFCSSLRKYGSFSVCACHKPSVYVTHGKSISTNEHLGQFVIPAAHIRMIVFMSSEHKFAHHKYKILFLFLFSTVLQKLREICTWFPQKICI